MFITAPAFVVLLLLGLLVLWLYVEIGSYPGKVARQRGHPQADAINVLGWLGPLASGVGWLVALVWAYMTPLADLNATAQANPPHGTPEESGAEEESTD
jgi:hypothetical protein